MAEQRQPFRFRLPWLSAAPAPRPAVESQPPRPTVETQPPSQPSTAIPTQRPTFRLPGIAPAQPTQPQVRAQPRTEPQPPSPRAATEIKVTSQRASPSRATTQIQGAASLPPSPPRAATESQAALEPASPPRTTQTRTSSVAPSPSPSRTVSKIEPALQTNHQPQSQSTGQTTSQSSSPSRTATQVQPTAGTAFLPPSPSKKLKPLNQETSRSQPPSSTSQQEPKPTVSQAVSREPQPKAEITSEPQPKAEITSETVLDALNQTMRGATFQPDGVATRPSQASGPVTVAVPTSAAAPETFGKTRANLKPLSESETKTEDLEEGNKGEKELTKADNSNVSASEEPTKRTITDLLMVATGSGSKSEPIQPEKLESCDRKISGKQIKSVSATNPNDSNRVQESQQNPVISNREQAPLQKEIREDISKLVHKLAIGQSKLPMNKKPVSVITLAGESRGASMYIGSQSAKKEESVHIHRGYKVKQDESTEATTDGEGSSKGRNSNDSLTEQDSTTKAHINSNIQSINNSILFNSSVTERDPGVQLVLSCNIVEPTKSDTKPEPLETHKAEFIVTPAQKLTYEPTIRRQCLRGIFKEPSNSDPDDPEKPGRHGYHYNCGDQSKDKEIEVL